MEGNQDASAGASVATAPAAAVRDLGTLGLRQAARAQRLRKRPSPATPLILGSAAGPGGAWRSRDLTQQPLRGGGVAPACLPKHAGARVQRPAGRLVPRWRPAPDGHTAGGDPPPEIRVLHRRV
jgi:hypothetical protein